MFTCTLATHGCSIESGFLLQQILAELNVTVYPIVTDSCGLYIMYSLTYWC